jgi:glycosyltransferase involved in cell wall biosynthesis
MKVLWVLNAPIGDVASVLGFPPAQSGTWINAAAEELIGRSDFSLGVATTANVVAMRKKVENNVVYYCIAGGRAHHGKRAPQACRVKWKEVIDDFQPDVIHFWGTEYTIPLDVIAVSPTVPKVVTIQGVIRSFERSIFQSVQSIRADVRSRLNFLEWIVFAMKCYRGYKKIWHQVPYEQQIVESVGNVIVDPNNNWAESFYRAMLPETITYHVCTRMNPLFVKGESWKIDNMVSHTIFCNAGSGARKGLHELIRALAIIRQRFPKVKLYIPGGMDSKIWRYQFSPYKNYLTKLMNSFGLENNVVFLGKLTSEEMAAQLRKSHIFVLASATENIPTSWREAMAVGTPCVLSQCGCIYEQVRHGEDAYMYRYGEYEVLADYCCKIFNNNAIAQQFSENGKKVIERQQSFVTDDGSDLINVYQTILRKH